LPLNKQGAATQEHGHIGGSSRGVLAEAGRFLLNQVLSAKSGCDLAHESIHALSFVGARTKTAVRDDEFVHTGILILPHDLGEFVGVTCDHRESPRSPGSLDGLGILVEKEQCLS
jgi:hypothetical protein